MAFFYRQTVSDTVLPNGNFHLKKWEGLLSMEEPVPDLLVLHNSVVSTSGTARDHYQINVIFIAFDI